MPLPSYAPEVLLDQPVVIIPNETSSPEEIGKYLRAYNPIPLCSPTKPEEWFNADLESIRYARNLATKNLSQIPIENLTAYVQKEIVAYKRLNWSVENGLIPSSIDNFRQDSADFFRILNENHLLTDTQKQYLVESCKIPAEILPDYSPGLLLREIASGYDKSQYVNQLAHFTPKPIRQAILRARNEDFDERTMRRRVSKLTKETTKCLKKLNLFPDDLSKLSQKLTNLLNKNPNDRRVLNLVRKAETARAMAGILTAKRGPTQTPATVPDFVRLIANTAAIKTSESWENLGSTNPFWPRPHTKALSEIYHHIYDLPETKNREKQRRILTAALPILFVASGLLQNSFSQAAIRAWKEFSEHPTEITRAVVNEAVNNIFPQHHYPPEEVERQEKRAMEDIIKESRNKPKQKIEVKTVASIPIKGPAGENLAGHIQVPKNTPEKIGNYTLSPDRVDPNGSPVYTDGQVYYKFDGNNFKRLTKQIVDRYTFMTSPPRELTYAGQHWNITNLNALGEPVWQNGNKYLTVVETKVQFLTLEELVKINRRPTKGSATTATGAHKDKKVPTVQITIPETVPAVADTISGIKADGASFLATPLSDNLSNNESIQFENYPKYRLRQEGNTNLANIYYLAPDNSLRLVGFVDEINHFKIEEKKQIQIPERPGEYFWEMTYLPGSNQYIDGRHKPLFDPGNHKVLWGVPDALLIQGASEATDHKPTLAFRDPFRPGHYKVDKDKGKTTVTERVSIAASARELEIHANKIQQLLNQGRNDEASLVQQQFDAAHTKTYEKDVSEVFFKLGS